MRKNLILATAFGAFLIGCAKSANPGPTVIITGTLQSSSRDGDDRPTPLAGYTVAYTTLTTPPQTGSAPTNSAGVFNLTATPGVPCACTVNNPSGTQVANLYFSTSSTTGTGNQTVSFNNNANLGNIPVNTTSGVAQVQITSTNTAAVTFPSTPTGTPCPLGTWTGQIGASDPPCCGASTPVTGQIWIGKDTSGKYIVSNTFNPTGDGGSSSCTATSLAIVAGTPAYSGGAFTFTAIGKGDNHPIAFTLTPDGSCATGTLKVVQTQCDSPCGDPSAAALQCNTSSGTGTTTCTSNNFTFTRK